MQRARVGRRAAGLAAAGLALLAAACQPLPATTTTTTTTGGNTTTTTVNAGGAARLASGRTLVAGQSLTSPDGRFHLNVQADGNVVERTPAGRALWTSKTSGNGGASLLMRSDGVLLLQAANAHVIWSTPTSGVKGATATLGSDGNLVVAGTAGNPVWANGASAASATRLPASQRHVSTQQLTLTKMYEGYVGTAAYQNSSGNCTVGYGHLLHLGACTSADRSKTYDADALFQADVPQYEARLKSSLGTVPMSQHEFDTIWDYVYGRGSLTAKTSPSMYAALTDSPVRYADVPTILRANGDTLIRGLCNRRYDEATVFAGGNYQRTSSC